MTFVDFWVLVENLRANIMYHSFSGNVGSLDFDIDVKNSDASLNALKNVMNLLFLLATLFFLKEEFDALIIDEVTRKFDACRKDQKVVKGSFNIKTRQLQADVEVVQPQQESSCK